MRILDWTEWGGGKDKVVLFIPLHRSLMRTDNVSHEMVVEDRWPLKLQCLTSFWSSSPCLGLYIYAQSDTDNTDTHQCTNTVTPQQLRWTSPDLMCSLIYFRGDWLVLLLFFVLFFLLYVLCVSGYIEACLSLAFHCFRDWILVWEGGICKILLDGKKSLSSRVRHVNIVIPDIDVL